MDAIDYLAELNPEAKILTGMDDCCVGTHEGEEGTVAVYDYDKIIEKFMKDGMTEEEAVEFYEYNTVRALPYMGKHAPIIITLF